MRTLKKLTLIGFIGTFVMFYVFVICMQSTNANAAEIDHPNEVQTCNDTGNSMKGIYTAISLSLNGGNDKVYATARNDLTIFPSTVNVIVQLFCSDTYQEDYNNMTLVAANSTLDLDMGQTISAEAFTENTQKYWIARTRYRVDQGTWNEKIVGPLLYDAHGNFIGIL